MTSKPKKVRDEVELAKLEKPPKEKRGRPGGLARAAKLTPERRRAIAKKANAARWAKKD